MALPTCYNSFNGNVWYIFVTDYCKINTKLFQLLKNPELKVEQTIEVFLPRSLKANEPILSNHKSQIIGYLSVGTSR